MWAAYDTESFKKLKKGMSKEEFLRMLISFCQAKSSCLVVEDDCKWFKSGRGPVAFVSIDNYGWRIEPHVDFFKWATPRIILRCCVAFFQMVRYSSQVGVCEIRSLESSVNLFDHLREYGLVFPAGKIPNGDPRGDEYLYYAKGRMNHAGANGDRSVLQRDDRRSGSEDSGEERTSGFSGTNVQSIKRGSSLRPKGTDDRSGRQRQIHADAVG